jgi:PAP_fibrillin
MIIFTTIALLAMLSNGFLGSAFMIPGTVSNNILRSSKSGAESPEVDDDAVVVGDDQVSMLKAELLTIAGKTNRGFRASRNEQSRIKEIIFQLRSLNPTAEPASSYYEGAASSVASDNNTLAGKWTLLYTDAPDITSLDTSQLPFSTAQLGRIGQECSPPYIKNVIEWKRPDWARNLPFTGSDDSGILQKVVTSATASPDMPRIVNLKVAGLELLSAGRSSSSSTSSMGADLPSRIREDGIIGGLLGANPVDLKGPWNPPFGQFEILYLDKEFRIIKTYQNYLAVNRRINPGEEWF